MNYLALVLFFIIVIIIAVVILCIFKILHKINLQESIRKMLVLQSKATFQMINAPSVDSPEFVAAYEYLLSTLTSPFYWDPGQNFPPITTAEGLKAFIITVRNEVQIEQRIINNIFINSYSSDGIEVEAQESIFQQLKTGQIGSVFKTVLLTYVPTSTGYKTSKIIGSVLTRIPDNGTM